jgi:predicted enzyme related to lactoylglutathione lyase
MGERSGYEAGIFCWAELATPDPDAAKAFYGPLLGWEASFQLDGADVAGLQEGENASWTSHVRVEDPAAIAERAGELGGEALEGAVRDPTGAVVGLRADGGAARVNEAGCMTWNELATKDLDRAKRFYSELLGWTLEDDPTGYAVVLSGGARNGGIRRAQDGEVEGWLVYFTVESVDDAATAIGEGGGNVTAGPMDVPAGRILVATDPQGARFALFQGDVDP